jgi:putative transposase
MNAIKTPSHQSALRKGRASIPGHVYFLTVCSENREAVFTAPQYAVTVSKECCHHRVWLDSVLLAWVLMPDHWHGLIQLGDQNSLSIIMQRFKSITTKQINITSHQSKKIWQSGFYDHAIREQESIKDVARYLLNNPVRAGLVKNVNDYPYWNTQWPSDDGLIL